MKLNYPDLKELSKRIALCLLLMYAGWYLKGRISPQGGMPQMGEVYILAQKAVTKDVTVANEKISYIEAINEVSLLPKVTGTVKKVMFVEGSLVKAGDVLFEIDPLKYQAAYDLAKARLDSAKAQYVKAERDYNRQVKLSREKFASKATFDTAESLYLQSKAAVEEAQANLDVATIDLENTKVTAPISGKISKAFVTQGNYVVASNIVLARIVQTNPIRISFSLTDKELAAIQKKGYKKEELNARIKLSTGDIINEQVRETFTDNVINPSTATVSVYADVDNSDNRLIPGNYVQTSISDNKPTYSLVVPQSALNQDQEGAFVYIAKVIPEKSSENELHGIAEQRRVVLGSATADNEQVILSGLTDGEMVITQGTIKIQNNSPIKIGVIENIKEGK